MKLRKSKLGILGSALMIQGSENTAGHVQRRGLQERKAELLRAQGIDVSPTEFVHGLTPREQSAVDEAVEQIREGLAR